MQSFSGGYRPHKIEPGDRDGCPSSVKKRKKTRKNSSRHSDVADISIWTSNNLIPHGRSPKALKLNAAFNLPVSVQIVKAGSIQFAALGCLL